MVRIEMMLPIELNGQNLISVGLMEIQTQTPVGKNVG